MLDVLAMGLILGGVAFYLAGTLGLLRLPDLYTRLHALTKADNLGLGLLATGLMLQAGGLLVALKLLLVWLLMLGASATGSHLVAQYARRQEQERRS